MTETGHRLKIGLDYHGVISDNPEYFKEFCRELRKRGHRLYVLTGGPEDKVREQLSAAGIVYDELFTIVDYFSSLGKVRYFPDGSFYIDENLWNRAKADFCRQNRIDVQIDDSPVYGKYFTTPYCLYNRQNQDCRLLLRGLRINLHDFPVEETILQLEKMLV